MGPEDDFDRLEELGFVRKGFVPPPDEGTTFICPRSGWKIGVPHHAGKYLVFPRDGAPTEAGSLDAAISRVRAAPILPPDERERLQRSLTDDRSISERAEEQLAGLREERPKTRETMKSPAYQRLWRAWNRFLRSLSE